MIFKRLFRRRSRSALDSENQESLIRIVRSEQDVGLRRDACRRLRDLSALHELASSDSDAGVREIALAHYRKLLCRRDAEGPDLSKRLEEVAVLEDQQIVEEVALSGQEAELRRAAIAKVTKQDVLCSCALTDALAANRSAAVERMDDKRSLERVVKNIGKKDKRVYRAARLKLKEISEREQLPERIRAQCEDLCEKLERLGRFGHWVQDRGMLDILDRQWAQIEPETGQDDKERYRQLRDRFLSAYGAYRDEHAAQIAAEEEREAIRKERCVLLDELQSLSSPSDDRAVAEDLERIAARWGELGALPDKEQASLEREYGVAREQVTAHLAELGEIARRNTRLGKLLERAEQFRERAKPLDRKQLQQLFKEAKPLLEAEGSDKSVAAGFAEVREALDERLRKQTAQAEKRLEALSEKLDELAGAIESGALKEAEPLYQSILASVELIELSGLPRKAYAQAASRLKTLAPRLRDLQKWRRWGADQHREELCCTMEALVSEDMSLATMALRLHDLQMEWKGLDRGGSPVNHPLWERFHAASDRVYERCRPYLDEQAAEREESRKNREQLCADLEDFLEQVDWERMDWKRAVRAELQMRQSWSSMGPVEVRYRNSLEKRYRSAMKRLSGHLVEERDRNQAHKRALIAEVEVLVEEPDLGRAIEETKRLQRQWHTTVPARQKEENRQWQRFRAACDAVFARRNAEQEARASELAENLRRREDLCTEAERLATSEATADELASALRDLDGRWRDSEVLTVPRQAAASLVGRWRRARALAEDYRRVCLAEQSRKDLALLADQAAICERLERALETETGGGAIQAVLEEQWHALPKQRDADLQTAIERRFSKALAASKQGDEALESFRSGFAANGARRAELCLHLEILAQVDSPPELTQERLQFQVARLTEHMREGEKDPLEATSRLLREWYLGGPAPASEAVALEERFLRARNAIELATRDNEAA